MSECLVFHDERNDADIWDSFFADMREGVVILSALYSMRVK